MPFKRPAFAIALISLLALPLAALAEPSYTITKIVDMDGYENDRGTVVAINNLGQGVGTFYHYETNRSVGYPAIFANGTVSVLPTPSGFFSSALSGINDSGIVAGNVCSSSLVASCGLSTISDDGITQLPKVTGQIRGNGWGGVINNSGQVAGSVQVRTTTGWGYHAILYTPGAGTSELAFGGDFNYALSINNAGAVAGFYADRVTNRWRAVLYSDSTAHELGTLGTDSLAFDLNDRGVGVGASAASDWDSLLPVMFVDGQVVALSDAPGQALAINNAGTVVGGFGTDSFSSAFIYSGGMMHDLNELVDPGWSLRGALDINDNGQILAEAYSPDGNHEYVLLTPTGISPVPEPGQCALLMAGLAIIATSARYRPRKRAQSTR